MLNSLKVVIASVAVSLGLAAAPAVAGPINGNITITGSVCPTCLPTIPSSSIVSGLTSINHYLNAGSVGALPSLDFSGLAFAAATMTGWTFAGPYPVIITVGGFSFDLNAAGAPVVGAFSCTGSAAEGYNCQDGLTIALSGIVSGNGFLPTAFAGTLSLSGSCASSDGVNCTTAQNYGAGFTYTLSANGRTVPEPATLALLAVALLGLGFLRVRTS